MDVTLSLDVKTQEKLWTKGGTFPDCQGASWVQDLLKHVCVAQNTALAMFMKRNRCSSARRRHLYYQHIRKASTWALSYIPVAINATGAGVSEVHGHVETGSGCSHTHVRHQLSGHGDRAGPQGKGTDDRAQLVWLMDTFTILLDFT